MTEERKDYFSYPRDTRVPESPYLIGGRDTDISQIAFTLYRLTRESFPVNKVPQGLVEKLDILVSKLQEAENGIQEYIEDLNYELHTTEGKE